MIEIGPELHKAIKGTRNVLVFWAVVCFLFWLGC